MKVQCQALDPFTAKLDGVVLFTYEEGSQAEERLAKRFPSLRPCRTRKEFEGKAKQSWLEKQAGQPRFTLLVGLGKQEKLTPDILRQGAALGAEQLRSLGCKEIGLLLPQELDPRILGQAAIEGALLRTYQFNAYKTQKLDEIKELSSIIIIAEKEAQEASKGVERGRIIAESCNMVRDLQNTPSADMTPKILAEHAEQLAAEEKLKCTVLDKPQLAKQGFNGILSVGKGSMNDPRLVTLEYAPQHAYHTIALVGKGITFDTGGISIKPSKGMAEMKYDMSGAGNVLGILRVASRLKLPIRLIGILCLAENMPDGGSYKPGDIVRTKSGKTIEIDNTDAEGRVVLADGLHHATTFTPDTIIDMATLTGAVIVALGDVAAGALGNNQELINSVIAAGEACGERCWQLPTWDEYAEDVKSQIADIKNVGMPGTAGTISGAMLLKEFVGETPWVHLDIAGVAMVSRERYFTPFGGTGFGVRLVTEYLSRR